MQFDPKTSNLIVRDVEEQLLRLTPSRALGGGEFYWESQWESTDGALVGRPPRPIPSVRVWQRRVQRGARQRRRAKARRAIAAHNTTETLCCAGGRQRGGAVRAVRCTTLQHRMR